MCQSLHWPRHGLSRLGLTTDGCKKLYLMDWKILEVNISDHDVAPFCNHLFVALWPHARQASSKEYGRLAPVNYPLCCSYWWPMHRAATRLMPISDWRMLIKCGSWLKVFGGSYLASAVWLVSRGEAARSFLLADFEGEMLGFLGGTKCFSVKKCGFSIMRNPINRFKVLGLTCFILLLFRFSFHANRYCGELSTAAVLATPVPWVIDLKIIRKG